VIPIMPLLLVTTADFSEIEIGTQFANTPNVRNILDLYYKKALEFIPISYIPKPDEET